jgi:hypothetical protein
MNDSPFKKMISNRKYRRMPNSGLWNFIKKSGTPITGNAAISTCDPF